MSDILTAMREFRALDDKRRGHGLGPDEEQRWNTLRSLLKGDRSQPAASRTATREPPAAPIPVTPAATVAMAPETKAAAPAPVAAAPAAPAPAPRAAAPEPARPARAPRAKPDAQGYVWHEESGLYWNVYAQHWYDPRTAAYYDTRGMPLAESLAQAAVAAALSAPALLGEAPAPIATLHLEQSFRSTSAPPPEPTTRIALLDHEEMLQPPAPAAAPPPAAHPVSFLPSAEPAAAPPAPEPEAANARPEEAAPPAVPEPEPTPSLPIVVAPPEELAPEEPAFRPELLPFEVTRGPAASGVTDEAEIAAGFAGWKEETGAEKTPAPGAFALPWEPEVEEEAPAAAAPGATSAPEAPVAAEAAPAVEVEEIEEVEEVDEVVLEEIAELASEDLAEEISVDEKTPVEPFRVGRTAETMPAVAAPQVEDDPFAAAPAVEQAFEAPPVADDPFAATPAVEQAFQAPPVADDPFAAAPAVEQAFEAPPVEDDPFAAAPAVEQAFEAPPVEDDPFAATPAVEQAFEAPPVDDPFAATPAVEQAFEAPPVEDDPFAAAPAAPTTSPAVDDPFALAAPPVDPFAVEVHVDPFATTAVENEPLSVAAVAEAAPVAAKLVAPPAADKPALAQPGPSSGWLYDPAEEEAEFTFNPVSAISLDGRIVEASAPPPAEADGELLIVSDEVPVAAEAILLDESDAEPLDELAVWHPPEGEEPPVPAQAIAPGPTRIVGERRVVIHTREGAVKRGSVANVDLAAPRIVFSADGRSEEITTSGLKAIFVMREAGEPDPVHEGPLVRITFLDGRSLQGSARDTGEPAGFFVVPADTRGGTARVFVYRAAIRSIA